MCVIKFMKRINIIGTSSSGKSTFAKQLSNKLSVKYIEMDSLFWKKDWEMSSDEEFFRKLENATSNDSWVLDGNYTRSISVKWKNVDTVIWIDNSFILTMYQAVFRALKRSILKRELWQGTGNKESFRKSFFSKESMIVWTCKTFFKNRKRNSSYFTNDNYKHINFVRLRSRKECREFLMNTIIMHI